MLRHRTAGGFQSGGVGLRPNTVTVLSGVALGSASRNLGEDETTTPEQARHLARLSVAGLGRLMEGEQA